MPYRLATAQYINILINYINSRGSARDSAEHHLLVYTQKQIKPNRADQLSRLPLTGPLSLAASCMERLTGASLPSASAHYAAQILMPS